MMLFDRETRQRPTQARRSATVELTNPTKPSSSSASPRARIVEQVRTTCRHHGTDLDLVTCGWLRG